MHPHMLRHTFVTTMLDGGVSLRDVQIAARHADPRMTMRYDRARKNLDRHPELHPRGVHGIRNRIKPTAPWRRRCHADELTFEAAQRWGWRCEGSRLALLLRALMQNEA